MQVNDLGPPGFSLGNIKSEIISDHFIGHHEPENTPLGMSTIADLSIRALYAVATAIFFGTCREFRRVYCKPLQRRRTDFPTASRLSQKLTVVQLYNRMRAALLDLWSFQIASFAGVWFTYQRKRLR